MPKNDNSFVTWTNQQEYSRASAEYSKAQSSIVPIQRSKASFANRFQNIDKPSTSVRDTYSRLDYEFFRPNEAMPRRHKDIIGACMEAYKRISIIRQVIDMMGDFCGQGVRLVHPNKSIEKFYQAWFEKVNGPERSERFANLLYRTGNVVIKRSTAILNDDQVSDWKKSIADADLDMPNVYDPQKMEIPIRYTFLNPMALEVVGEQIAAFTGRLQYVLRMPDRVSSILNTGLFGLDPSSLLDDIPTDISNAINTNQKYLPLNNDKLLTFFYKKDDWEVWAYPMLYSLLDDLIFLEKMKLADLTALDGIISHIRIWKLGSLEHKIFPTDAAIAKLSSVLLNHVAGGAMDFIWGPDLTIEETSTDLYKFLGSEKYQAVISSIHSGLGIPAAIGGSSGSFADNFMSLRTIIERLEYGRRMINSFWMGEIKFVQQAMGFRYPAQVVFDNMNFHDENSEKALWIQLVDRNIVSEESVQEKFGQIPEIEQIRLRREREAIEERKRSSKVSPYHDAQPQLSMKKIALQRGLITPGQAGMELAKKAPGEKTMVDMQNEQQNQQMQLNHKQKLAQIKQNALNPPIGTPGQGRPSGKQDTTQRKQRIVKPNSKADLEEFVNLTLYANQAQKIIHDKSLPYFLDKFDKSNLRQLTQAEEKEFDDFKHCLLYNVPVAQFATEEIIMETFGNKLSIDNNALSLYNQLVIDFRSSKGREPTYDDIKQLRSLVYSSIKGLYNDESETE